MRSIVTVAGGSHYGCNAYASIRLLRDLGCQLPVEWYYLNDKEMPPNWLAAAEAIPDVRCHNLMQGTVDNRKACGGWQSKITAILAADADEVLFMDADNFARRDPTYLFDSELYLAHGAVLWPDISVWEADRRAVLKSYFGVYPQHESQTESGQLLFDKQRCRAALEQVAVYNCDSAYVYKIVYGDKDTFYFGFVATGTPFNYIPKPPKCGRGCLLQHDPYGEILFTHLTGGKWAIHGRPFTDEGSLPHLQLCRTYLAELREHLTRF
jgi:alpha 1,2-mannosyltransferase